jgi:hypothetical protein
MSSTPPEKAILPGPLVDAWRADVPSTGELRHGYARFMRQRSRRAVPLVVRWLVAGLVLGIGLAQAAALVRPHWFAARELQATSSKRALKASMNQPQMAPLPPSVPSAEPTPPAPLERSTASAPAPIVSRGPAQPASVEEQWQRAAAALRNEDFARAQSALLDVELRTFGAERDAARLSRAQLLATSGHPLEALTLASALAVSAQSNVVREKARELAARLAKKNDSSDRSPEPAPAIKQP